MANRKSIPPPSSNTKYVLFFLIGGIVILVAAGMLLFKRRSEEPPPPPPVQVEEKTDVPVPLVAAQPTRPPSLDKEDAGPTVAVMTEKPKPRRGGGRGGGQVERMGSIDAAEVNKFMNARFGQVKACYERRLKLNPLLEGKLDLNIGVSSKGKVTSVGVNSDTLRDPPMIGCVKRTIRNWQFPKPEGGRVVIGKTFNFKKKK